MELSATREQLELPRCRCRHATWEWDRCPNRTPSPDSWLCWECEAEHRTGQPGSPFIVVPLR